MPAVIHQPDSVAAQPEPDRSSPWPCGVCHEDFRSRRDLATHRHEKKGVRE